MRCTGQDIWCTGQKTQGRGQEIWCTGEDIRCMGQDIRRPGKDMPVRRISGAGGMVSYLRQTMYCPAMHAIVLSCVQSNHLPSFPTF